MQLENLVVYQLYPKSFKDTTGSGTGDLRGVIEKMDYLKTLGVDMIWMNPFYPSPQNDNGYDVADYRAIDPKFGTMADFEELVQAAEARDIGIMLDMVLNHTSTAHEWFQKALAGDKKYQDYYYLRPAQADGSLPTNWASKFGGPAWEPFGETDQYYLHLYDVTQADLNWHNPEVRQELHDIVNFWLDKGVRGFRFDVLNVIGKPENMPDSTGGPGSDQEKSIYTDTPIVHEWIHELNQATFGQREDIVTVGEMSSTTIPDGIKYTNPEDHELSMIFNFHHLKVDYDHGEKWTKAPFDFIELKRILNDWQSGMSAGHGWNALFLNNHDQPRANSRFGDVENYPYATATMLAQTIHLLRGTPYIYQGEEIGMTNPNYTSIEQYDDVESHNNYQILLDQGVSEADALEILQQKSRDNSRTPMQWDASPQAGFSKGEPWLEVAPNYQTVNVEQELQKDGIFKYYQRLISLRKQEPTISQGSYQGLLLDHPQVMAFVRETAQQQLLVFSHFYGGQVTVDLPETFKHRPFKELIGNGQVTVTDQQVTLDSYGTTALLFEKSHD